MPFRNTRLIVLTRTVLSPQALISQISNVGSPMLQGHSRPPLQARSRVGSQTPQEHSRPLQARYRTLQAAPGGIIPGSWCPNEPGLVPRRPEHPPKTLQCRHKTISNCVSLRTCAISCFVMLSARSDGSKGELPPAEICHCP